jgi:hypothetical protein
MSFRKDFFYLFLLLGLGIIFWDEALAPGKIFFYRDIPLEIVAKKLFWSGSGYPTLWSPYSFFGVPQAANAQSGAFDPLNFLFLLFGPERGVVYDVVFHHLFFLTTFYLALREVGFKEEASLIGAIGFGFSGCSISLAFMPLLFRNIAWLGLLIICLDKALEKGWFKWSLLLGLVMAAQIIDGEIQLAGMSWFLALGVVVLAPKRKVSPRDVFKALGAVVLGLVGVVIIYLPQIALTRELLPLSNRAGGVTLADATNESFSLSKLGSFFIPNYILPASDYSFWYLGFFYGFPYLLSHYLGITLLFLVVLAFIGPNKWKALFWLVLALFSLGMMLGSNLGVYPFFYRYLPGFGSFRFPEKFFLYLNFGFILIAVYGYEYISGRKKLFPWVSWACLWAALVIIFFLLIYPLRIPEFGNNYRAVAEYLFERNILRISVFFLISLGLILLIGKVRTSWLGLGLTLVLFLDLFVAHHQLNPVTTKDFFRPNELVREFLSKEKDRIVPPRIFSIIRPDQDLLLNDTSNPREYVDNSQKELLSDGWSTYFGLNDIRWSGGSFFPTEWNRYKNLTEKARYPQNYLILARSGVEYSYIRDQGFTEIPGAFPRAAVYYQARTMSDRDQIENLWSDPDFPADQVLLVEARTGGEEAASGSLKSEPARIVEYQNERVVVEAEARESGWLLLLDSYYPGWKAEVDGHPVDIFRADGFFRAVRIPEGKHRIVFNYRPAILEKSVWISGIGFLIWLGLILAPPGFPIRIFRL